MIKEVHLHNTPLFSLQICFFLRNICNQTRQCCILFKPMAQKHTLLTIDETLFNNLHHLFQSLIVR